jgi:hypothetical protein
LGQLWGTPGCCEQVMAYWGAEIPGEMRPNTAPRCLTLL